MYGVESIVRSGAVRCGLYALPLLVTSPRALAARGDRRHLLLELGRSVCLESLLVGVAAFLVDVLLGVEQRALVGLRVFHQPLQRTRRNAPSDRHRDVYRHAAPARLI